jgi:hypothetical protein
VSIDIVTRLQTQVIGYDIQDDQKMIDEAATEILRQRMVIAALDHKLLTLLEEADATKPIGLRIGVKPSEDTSSDERYEAECRFDGKDVV